MTKKTKNQDRRYFLSLAVQAHTISLLASALISLW